MSAFVCAQTLVSSITDATAIDTMIPAVLPLIVVFFNETTPVVTSQPPRSVPVWCVFECVCV